MGSKKRRKKKKKKYVEYRGNNRKIENVGYPSGKKAIKESAYLDEEDNIEDGEYLDEEDEIEDSGYLDEEDNTEDSGYLDEEDNTAELKCLDIEVGIEDKKYSDVEDDSEGNADDGRDRSDDENTDDDGYLEEDEDIDDEIIDYLDDDYDEPPEEEDNDESEAEEAVEEEDDEPEDEESFETDEEIEDYRRRRRKRFRMGVLVCLMLAITFIAGSIYYISSLAYGVCRVEAGVEVSPSDFLKNPDENAFFTSNSQAFDIAEPGEYKVKVKSGLFVHWCKLIIEDTIAPQANPVNVVLELGGSCGAEQFVTDVSDATQVKAAYVEIPDFTKVGSQPVRITLTDKGNNQTIYDVELFISPVFTDVMVEAGNKAPAIESFLIEAADASFITPIDGLDYTKAGEHEISINVDGQTYQSMLHVIDTTAPEVEVKDVEGYALVPVTTEDFTVSIEDITEVSAAFVTEPDLSRIGVQDLEIVYTDEGNNDVIKQVELTLIEDTEAPVIEGAADMRIFIGDSVSYRKDVTVTDNCPEGLLMTVDTSSVNLNEEGVYPVTYTAVDMAGNTSEVTVNLTVTPRVYDINEVYAIADSVLAKIITPEMTQLEQARAIFDYVTKHVGYINDSAKDDWVRGAYEGLVYGKGDCFVYACTSKVLLTRAGIVNMDIEKIPAKTLHYWNLVDVGDGWYHFDTTPRKDHPVIFMWNDAQMMDYSEKHNKSHNYDHSLYPAVN